MLQSESKNPLLSAICKRRQTFSINFVCRLSKLSKSGAPIECSISVNGSRTYISLPRKCDPSQFRKDMASRKHNETKQFCSSVSARINECVTELIAIGKEVTASSIKTMYLGGVTSNSRVSDLFNEYIDLQKERVGKTLTMGVFRKYGLVRDSFVQWCSDCLVADINSGTVQGYYNHLRSVYKPQTVQGYMTKVKSVLRYGRQQGRLKCDPFDGLRIKREVSEVQFLSSEELERIEGYESGIDRIDKVRDLFLFMCYTGLSYCDMSDFSKEDVEEVEGGYMLHKRRKKTNVFYTIFLLPKAVAILDKYDWELPVISNCKMNLYLKEIADVCRIGKPLHCHIARHSFATTMLNAGLSLDFVSKTLGHSSTRLSAHYAKVLDRTVVDAMRSMSVFN